MEIARVDAVFDPSLDVAAFFVHERGRTELYIAYLDSRGDLKMPQPVKAIPAGYHTVNVYLSVKDAKRAIDFYKEAMNATEIYRFDMPDGRIGHAELQIGDSRLMLADEMPDMPDIVVRSPETLGGSTFGLHVYLPDVDSVFDRAIAAGAVVRRPVKDQFYGDRSGTFEDPFGHVWTLATHVEDVSLEEMKRRMAAAEAAPQVAGSGG